MEEDIKILKEIKEEYDYAFGTKIYRPHSISREEIQAIENILNRLEQDEKVINKAIEYVESNARKCGNGEEWFESSYCCTSLLNILKRN